jgi:ribonucleotide reductase alpha subunit
MFKQPICYEIWGGSNGKYRLRDHKGEPVDQTPDDTCNRVSRALADVELNDKEKWYEKFRSIIGTRFAGGGRIMANAGATGYKKEVSLINCCVSQQISDSLESIADVVKEAALVLKAGCGIGYDFSTLRPKGAMVFGAGAGTSGVVSFMKIFDATCGTILSGGGRRGSQMGALDCQHPDIEEFVKAKRQDGVLRYFNVSALITDRFMSAVENDEMWELWFWEKIRDRKKENISGEIKIINRNDIPFNYPEYNFFSYAEDHNEVSYKNCTIDDVFIKKIYKTMKARELFDLIIKSTYDFNDPGFLSIDRVNYENNLWFCETIRVSNPCQPAYAKLLTPKGIFILGEVNIGDIIWSGKQWTKITNKICTGIKKVYAYETLAGIFYGTENHKVVSNGIKKEVKDVKSIDISPHPNNILSNYETILPINWIDNITYIGEEEVFDITVEAEEHTYWTDGLLVSNCGEQFLPPHGSCLLGSIILTLYIKNQFEDNVSFDWEQYTKDIRVANRALDNVVEINNLPLKEFDEYLRYTRRHGLGFTGLGSLFNLLGIAYGSEESISFAEKLMLIMAQQSLLENIEVAKEKGAAPVFSSIESRELFMQSGYMKRLFETFDNKEQIISDILQYGIRWSHATAIAPTGTMSLTWGNNCSNGIEPIFANSYLRNIRAAGKKTKTQEEVFDYAYLEWKNKYGDKPLPDYWRTTENLSIEEHTSIQTVVQKWCDTSISKTINVPTDYPYDKFKDVYINAWKNGIKGITTYRFNPEITAGVLVQKSDLDNSRYTFTLSDGSEVTVSGSDTILYDNEEHIAANLFDALKEGLYGNM